MKTALIALLGMASMCVAQAADNQDLAGALNKHYLNQTLVLRRAVTENSLTYDPCGHVTKPSS